MCDFTVRGWRVADTTGIEEYFEGSTAKDLNSQGCVKSLKYEDTSIGENANISLFF